MAEGFQLGGGVGHGYGESGAAGERHVGQVVAYPGGFFFGDAGLFQALVEGGGFGFLAEVDVVHTKLAGAVADGFGTASGDEAGADAHDAGELEAGSVAGVEDLEFGNTLDAGGGDEADAAVGEGSIYVHEKELDFAGASLDVSVCGHASDCSFWSGSFHRLAYSLWAIYPRSMSFRHLLACGLALPLSLFAVAQSTQQAAPASSSTPGQQAPQTAPAQQAPAAPQSAPAQKNNVPPLQLHNLPPADHTPTPQELEQQKVARMRIALTNLARAQANWGPPESTPGMSLALKETGRTKNASGATEITYQITGKGFTPDMQLTLLRWPLNEKAARVMSGIEMNASGTAVCGVPAPGPAAPTDAAGAAAQKNGNAEPAPPCIRTMKPGTPISITATAAKGEPIRVALVAADRKHGAAVTMVPFPIEATDRGCKISVILGAKDAELVLVEGEGFHNDPKYTLGTESYGEKHPLNVKVSEKGRFVAAVTPWAPHHDVGDTVVYYQSSTCTPTVSLHWGKNSYKPE